MWAVGTTGMTLFSLIFSIWTHKKFVEPQALNRSFYPLRKKNSASFATGYIVHYGVGLIFSALFKGLWDRGVPRGPSASGLLGLAGGIAGIGGWQLLFKAFHRPLMNIKKYYLHLIAAHIIFGWLNDLVFTKMKKEAPKKERRYGIKKNGYVMAGSPP